MNKTTLLKELFNEITEIIEYKEKNKGWYWGDRKYSKSRFKRLRLIIEETLKGIENDR